MIRAEERLLARLRARAEADCCYLPDAPPLAEDTLWRGLSRGGELRLLVARATASVAAMTATLGANPETAELLAELTVGGLLVRSAMDPNAQMQLTIRNPGTAGRLYLDVWPSGRGFRASVQHPGAAGKTRAELFAGGEFDLTRSRRGGQPHRSVKILGRESLAEAYMAHLLESDQIRAILRLDVRRDGGGSLRACGFLVQVTPEGRREDVERLLRNLDGLPALSDSMTDVDPDARAFGDRLFAGYRWDQVAREPVRFVCRCSRERLVAVLRAMPGDDRREMIEAGEPIETTCEFCRARYEISPAELV